MLENYPLTNIYVTDNDGHQAIFRNTYPKHSTIQCLMDSYPKWQRIDIVIIKQPECGVKHYNNAIVKVR